MKKSEHLEFKSIIDNIHNFEPNSIQKGALNLLKTPDEYFFNQAQYLELITHCILKDFDTVLFIKNIHMEDYPEFDIEGSDFFSHFYTKIISSKDFLLLNGDFFENIPKNENNIIKEVSFHYCFEKNQLFINGHIYSFLELKKQIEILTKSASLFYIENHHIINLIQDHYAFLNKDRFYDFIVNPQDNMDYLINEIKQLFKRMYLININAPEYQNLENERYCSILNTSYIPENIKQEEMFFIIDEFSLKQELKILSFILIFSEKVCNNLSHNLISYSNDKDELKAIFYFSEDEHQIKDFIWSTEMSISIINNNFTMVINDSIRKSSLYDKSLKDCIDELCLFAIQKIQSFYKETDSFYNNLYKKTVINQILNFPDIDKNNIEELVITIHPFSGLWINSVDVNFSVYNNDKQIFNFNQFFCNKSYSYRDLIKQTLVLNAALEQSAISKKIKKSSDGDILHKKRI